MNRDAMVWAMGLAVDACLDQAIEYQAKGWTGCVPLVLSRAETITKETLVLVHGMPNKLNMDFLRNSCEIYGKTLEKFGSETPTERRLRLALHALVQYMVA